MHKSNLIESSEGKFRIKNHSYSKDIIMKFNLQPTVPLNLNKYKTVNDLVNGYKDTSFGARALGEAADILYKMVTDKNCFVVGTFSGAMTIAKMGLVLCDMIDYGMLDAIVSTGALMAHGFVEATGRTHFKYKNELNDKELFLSSLDRVYDTLESENNLDDVEIIFSKVVSRLNPKKKVCSHVINRELGKYLNNNIRGRGILKSAYKNKIPVYVPAFTDSELGLDFGVLNRRRGNQRKRQYTFDPFLDLEHYTKLVQKQKRLGVFTIGGGVPRNWAQQVCPYLDIIRYRIIEKKPRHKAGKNNPWFKRFIYGVRVCPEPDHWGGLSGCSYSEGISWGKFVPEDEGGQFAEVKADATIAWPLIVKAVMERLDD